MTIRLPIALFWFSSLLMAGCQPSPTPDAQPPNIIFIIADDHASHAISAYGSKINQTPNIDRIASQGMRFDNVFCTNSICAPSRAVILTGKFSHRNGVLDNAQTFDSSQVTMPKLLRRAGYQTAAIGKWHLKSRPTGFDYYNVLPGQGLYYNPSFVENGQTRQYEGYVTDLITDFALEWLDKVDTERPFYLWLGHKAPHRNWMPGPDHLTTYDDQDIPEPATLFDDYQGRQAAALQELSIARDMHTAYDLKVVEAENDNGTWADHWLSNRLSSLTPAQREAWHAAYDSKNETFMEANLQGEALVRWKYQRYIKDYLRTIASVDDNIGRLLDFLEARGLSDNTLIVYTSDQGFYLGDHGWFDKRFMYEESYRMPFIVQYPGIVPPGSTNQDLIMNVDFAPTFLDLAGLPVPDDMQGRSFRPVLDEGRTPAGWRTATYYHYYEYPGVHAVKRHYGVRTDRYKLIHFYYDIDSWELYDLQADPDELKNVYDDPAYADVRAGLHVQLEEQMRHYGEDPAVFTRTLYQQDLDHLAAGAPVDFRLPPDIRHEENKETVLTDGKYWEYSIYSAIRQNDWLGFQNNDCELVVDLGATKTINQLGVNCYQQPIARIFYPERVNFFISEDGKNYQAAGGITVMDNDYLDGTKWHEVEVPGRRARYVKVVIDRLDFVPEGRNAEGQPAWLFIDEISVR